MGFFKRKGSGSEAPTEKPKQAETQRVGIVSGVLSDARREDGDSSMEDLVARRFGPEAEAAAEEPSLTEGAARSVAPPPMLIDSPGVETPALEVDPMAHIGRATTVRGFHRYTATLPGKLPHSPKSFGIGKR